MNNYGISAFTEHWMLKHGTDITCPRLKFELITTTLTHSEGELVTPCIISIMGH